MCPLVGVALAVDDKRGWAYLWRHEEGLEEMGTQSSSPAGGGVVASMAGLAAQALRRGWVLLQPGRSGLEELLESHLASDLLACLCHTDPLLWRQSDLAPRSPASHDLRFARVSVQTRANAAKFSSS